jgi:hypothetical protein
LPPDTTPEEEGTPPAERWSADGVFEDGEYLSEMQYANGNYEIRWMSDDQYIYIGIRARTTGWAAVGIQPGTRMRDADIIMGAIEGGEVTIYDMFSTGTFGPHPPDTELGGSHDIVEFGGREGGGFTTIEFKRALDTGDNFDHPLSQGVHQIIWSFGSDDRSDIKHVTRGYGEIRL